MAKPTLRESVDAITGTVREQVAQHGGVRALGKEMLDGAKAKTTSVADDVRRTFDVNREDTKDATIARLKEEIALKDAYIQGLLKNERRED